MDIVKILSNSDLFHEHNESDVRKLMSDISCVVKTFGRKEMIHHEGELCKGLELILFGTVVVEKYDVEGNVFQVVKFKSGDSIGGNLLYGSVDSYPMTITAENEVQILFISKEDVLKLAMRSETFLKAFLKSVSDKSIILTGKIKSISHTGIRDRIKAYLAYEYAVQGSDTIKLTYSKKELAERFGVQRTSLSRELQKMKSEGLIDFDRKTITINYDVE